MRVIADFCLVPIGIGVSVSKEVAACERVLAEAGLKTNLHAYGTNIEGEWDDVFAAIKRCHEVVHSMEPLASHQPSASAPAPTGHKPWKTRSAALKKKSEGSHNNSRVGRTPPSAPVPPVRLLTASIHRSCSRPPPP